MSNELASRSEYRRPEAAEAPCGQRVRPVGFGLPLDLTKLFRSRIMSRARNSGVGLARRCYLRCRQLLDSCRAGRDGGRFRSQDRRRRDRQAARLAGRLRDGREGGVHHVWRGRLQCGRDRLSGRRRCDECAEHERRNPSHHQSSEMTGSARHARAEFTSWLNLQQNRRQIKFTSFIIPLSDA